MIDRHASCAFPPIKPSRLRSNARRCVKSSGISKGILYKPAMSMNTDPSSLSTGIPPQRSENAQQDHQSPHAPLNLNDNLPQTTVGAQIQTSSPGIAFLQYSLALEPLYLPQIRDLIGKDLSEPYSIYVYRYFLYQWAELCFLAIDTTISPHRSSTNLVGAVICKLERHRNGPLRGYIAMLATKDSYRGRGIATTLVSKAIDFMMAKDADEIALETEETNTAAMKLYERLGFLRSKKLHRYYLNGNSAYRLLLYLKPGVSGIPTDDYWDPYGDLPPSAQDDPSYRQLGGRQDYFDDSSGGII